MTAVLATRMMISLAKYGISSFTTNGTGSVTGQKAGLSESRPSVNVKHDKGNATTTTSTTTEDDDNGSSRRNVVECEHCQIKESRIKELEDVVRKKE